MTRFVQFFHAERVLLENYTIINAPFWINHLVYTSSATVRNLKVESHFANNDGLDIESSQLVLAENNWFQTGDDSVVVKSGRDLDGRNIGIPSKDIVVRNNDMGGDARIALAAKCRAASAMYTSSTTFCAKAFLPFASRPILIAVD